MVLISESTQFPYYIVRFKLAILFYFYSILRYCFHTTQYDLNCLFRKLHFSHQISFHTTQYDLNYEWRKKNRMGMCCFHTTQYDLNMAGAAKNAATGKKSFHTTQYDLNKYRYFFVRDEVWFPYYIVRFKLVLFFLPRLAGQVSILHSTI